MNKVVSVQDDANEGGSNLLKLLKTKTNVSSPNKEEGRGITKGPEGGWGYVITLSLGMLMIMQFGLMTSLGILFNERLEQMTGSSDAAFKLMTTTNSYLFIFSGLSTFAMNFLLKFLTPRIVCIIGALCMLSADLLLIFMKSSIDFFISQAILKGVACGLLLPVGFVVLNGYFKLRRTSMVSLAEIFPCISGSILPSIVVFLMQRYGFQGTLMLLLAFNMHSICIAIAMKKSATDKTGRLKDSGSMTDNNNDFGTNTIQELQIINELKSQIGHENETKDFNVTTHYFETNGKNIESIGVFAKMIKTMDLRLLCDPVFDSIIIGVSLIMFADILFISSLPMILLSLFSENDAAFILSVASGTEILFKFFIAAVNYYMPINNRLTFFMASILTAVCRIAMVQRDEVNHVLVCYSLLSGFRAMAQVTYLLVLADHVSKKRYPAAMGLFNAMWVIVFVVGNAVIGNIKEISEGYTTFIYIINGCNAICIIMWSIEYCFRVNRSCNIMKF